MKDFGCYLRYHLPDQKKNITHCKGFGTHRLALGSPIRMSSGHGSQALNHLAYAATAYLDLERQS